MVEVKKQIRAAIYLRVSTDEQTEKFGLEAQLNAIRAYITSRGQFDDGRDIMVLAGEQYIYQDDISGTLDIDERPAFARLKEDLVLSPKSNKPFDAVIVYKIDRFARRLTVLLNVVNLFDEYAIKFISVNETIDTSTPFGKAILNIMGVIAELEVETIKQRTQAGIAVSINKGSYMGHPPYGYKKDKENKLIPFKKEAEVVGTIFRMCVIEDKNPKQIADWLRDNKFVSPEISSVNNKKRAGHSKKINDPFFWTTQSVRSMLANEVYIGQYYYKKSEERKRLSKDKWQLSPYHHSPIIEKLMFEKAQQKLKAIASKVALNRKRGGDRLYLLSGLLKCAYCTPHGEDWHTWQGTKKIKNGKWNFSYFCGHKNSQKYTSTCPVLPVPALQLENYIISFVTTLLHNPKLVYDYQMQLRSTRQQVKQLKAKRDILLTNLQNIPQRRINLSTQHEIGFIPYKEFELRKAKIIMEENKWRREYDEISRTLGQVEMSDEYTKSFTEYAKKHEQVLKEVVKNPQGMYDLIHGLIEEIIVHSRPYNPKYDGRLPGKPKQSNVVQQIPNEIEIVLKMPQAILAELADVVVRTLEFGVRDDTGWVRIESNYGPLSYQESVLPLNYAPPSPSQQILTYGSLDIQSQDDSVDTQVSIKGGICLREKIQ